MQDFYKNSVRLLLLCFIGFSLAGCFGAKDNTPPPTPLVSFKPSIQVNKLWSTHATDGVGKQYLKLNLATTPKYIITAGRKGNITVLNRFNGERVWHVHTRHLITAGPAVGNGIVVVGTAEAQVLAFNLANGKFLWQRTIANQALATPAIGRNKVIIKTVDGHLIALSARTGKKLWSYADAAPTMILRGGSQPRIIGNTVLVGFADGTLQAFSLNSGSQLWSQAVAEPMGIAEIQRMVDITISPKVSNGQVYIATYQGKIAAINFTTGTVIWSHKMSSFSGLTVGRNRVYISDAASHVWGLNKNSGIVLWQQKRLYARNITGPVLMGRYLVVGDREGFVHWMALNDGHFVARVPVGGNGVLANPKVVGKTLYILTRNGTVSAYRIGHR